MEIKWTRSALSDLQRLYEFLAPINHIAAARIIQTLTQAPDKIIHQPRIGERLDEFECKEIRRLLVGHYEMRYEIRNNCFYVLRILHTKEER